MNAILCDNPILSYIIHYEYWYSLGMGCNGAWSMSVFTSPEVDLTITRENAKKRKKKGSNTSLFIAKPSIF